MSRFALAAALLALVPAAAAQQPADPLAGDHDLVPSNEVALFWVNGPPDGPARPVQRALLDYVAFGNPALEDSLQLLDRAEAAAAPAAGRRAMDVAVADFFGGATQDVVQVWEGEDGSLALGLPTVVLEDGSGPIPDLAWGASTDATLRPAGTLREFDTTTLLRLVVGQFDDDPESEVVLAYGAADYSVPVEVHDVGPGGLDLAAEVPAAGRIVLPDNVSDRVSTSTWLDVATGDLDGDGTDEVVVGATQEEACSSSGGCWAYRVWAYRVEAGALVPLSEARVVGKADDQQYDQLAKAEVAVADLDGDGLGEVVVGFQNRLPGSSQAQWYARWLRVEDGALVPGEDRTHRVSQTTGSTTFPLTLIAADLDLDGRDEVVYGYRQVAVLRLDDASGELTGTNGFTPSGSFDQTTSAAFVAVADLDGADALWYETSEATASRPEIVTAHLTDVSTDGGMSVDGLLVLTVFRTNEFGGFSEVGRRTLGLDDWSGTRPLALAVGDFADRGVRLGPPRYFRRTDIAQPLVVLNAPPVHYDVFDGQPYDVAGCYPGATCGFSATYTEQSTQTVEVTTEVVGDWNVGAEVEIGVGRALQTTPTPGGAGGAGSLITKLTGGISARFAASYGEGFTDLVGSSRTITVTSQVQIFQEDHVYADVVDLDVWEYPLYVRGEPAGHLALALPRPETDAWFGVSTPTATGYRPSHEPGNILSYARDLAPRRLSQTVFEGSRYGLGSSAVLWDVTQETTEFQSSEDRTRLRLEGEIDLDIPIKAVNLGINLNGDYSRQTFDTHRTSVSDLEAVRVEFGPINASIEGRQATYAVTPFVYWDRSGALVVDYAVEPSVAAPGEEPTWWQERYGQAPDLALNLPDRYRDLKLNDPAVSEATKERTKGLAFAANPDGSLSVGVEAHNYSLLPSPGGVPVRLFAGDPDAGGVALTGPGLAPDPTLPAMEPRGRATVRTTVTLPPGAADPTTRIYAVLDPDGAVAEIHETNNVGWAPLGLEAPTAGEGGPRGPRAARLGAAFPNPFRERLTVPFALEAAGPVRLVVLDVLGREVAVLADGPMAAGRHEAGLEARGLAAGPYVVRLEAAGAAAARTVVRVR